jgi:hypothetical protein
LGGFTQAGGTGFGPDSDGVAIGAERESFVEAQTIAMTPKP